MSYDELPEIPIDTIAETENYSIWASDEPDGERSYHLELGPVTAHFFTEEWNEFLELIAEAAEETSDDPEADMEIEMDWGSLLLTRDEWTEFVALLDQAR